MGDALCIFNPVYGQGMSVAAQEAVLLSRLLANPEVDVLSTLADTFFGQLESILEAPWAMSAIPDFIFPDTTGQRPADLEQILKFGAALTRLASREADVHKIMADVSNLLKPRSVYREPELASRVMAEMQAI